MNRAALRRPALVVPLSSGSKGWLATPSVGEAPSSGWRALFRKLGSLCQPGEWKAPVSYRLLACARAHHKPSVARPVVAMFSAVLSLLPRMCGERSSLSLAEGPLELIRHRLQDKAQRRASRPVSMTSASMPGPIADLPIRLSSSLSRPMRTLKAGLCCRRPSAGRVRSKQRDPRAPAWSSDQMT